MNAKRQKGKRENRKRSPHVSSRYRQRMGGGMGAKKRHYVASPWSVVFLWGCVNGIVKKPPGQRTKCQEAM